MTLKIDFFQGRARQCVDALLLLAHYFEGDFEHAFTKMKKLIPLNTMSDLDMTVFSDCMLADTAISIYLMEGEALYAAKYAADHKRPITSAEYSCPLLYLGEYHQQLVESCRFDFLPRSQG